MYVRQAEYARPGRGISKGIKPVWHLVNEKAILSFTKKVTSKCGLEFPLNTGKNEVVDKITETRICNQCISIEKGRNNEGKKWASTGIRHVG